LEQFADAAGEGGAFLGLGLVGERLAADVLVVGDNKDGGMGGVGTEVSDVAEENDVGAVLAGAAGPVDPGVLGELTVTGFGAVCEQEDTGLRYPGGETAEQGMQLAKGIGELVGDRRDSEGIAGPTDPVEGIDEDGTRVGAGEDVGDAGQAERAMLAEGIGEG
jgi:hypothetical protein